MHRNIHPENDKDVEAFKEQVRQDPKATREALRACLDEQMRAHKERLKRYVDENNPT